MSSKRMENMYDTNECYTAVNMNETDLHGSTWMDCTNKK